MRTRFITSAPCKCAGLGFSAIPSAALAAYQRAAEKGSGAASLQLGVIYATGRGVPQDYAEAARWYSQAAEQGLTEGRYNLGVPAPARAWACAKIRRVHLISWSKRRRRAACRPLGLCMSSSPQVRMSWKTQSLAAQWLLRAADLGSGPATCLLAQMLDRGDPTAPAKERVVTLLARSAVSAAMPPLKRTSPCGIWRASTDCTTPKLALRWFHRAAHGGNAFAQAWLGDAYATGQGVKADLAEATIWYERAALQGHGGATRVLTSMGVAAGAASRRDGSIVQPLAQGRRTGRCASHSELSAISACAESASSARRAKQSRWLGRIRRPRRYGGDGIARRTYPGESRKFGKISSSGRAIPARRRAGQHRCGIQPGRMSAARLRRSAGRQGGGTQLSRRGGAQS